MKELNYTQNRPPVSPFDNRRAGVIFSWMHLLRLKAIRGVAAAGLIFTVGCQSDAEGQTVPTRTVTSLPTATVEPQPVLLAAAETDQPVKLDKPAVAAEVSTNPPPASANVPVSSAIAVTNTPSTLAETTTTNAAPVITEVIEPARPANLKISASTEKVIKLAESNLDEKVILTFVEQTPAKFELDADEILYLSDVGVPSTVIAAMLKHDGDDPTKAETLTAAANTEEAQPAIPATPAAIAQTLPPPAQGQAIEVTTNYVPNPNQPIIVQQQPQTVVVEQQPTVVYSQPENVSYFYDSLSPYGSWMYVTDYGWCWQPTVAVVDHGWRPYGHRGHWLWTTSGWYWQSDYSWGWAPFHYGRWHHGGPRGWLWVPDRTWGPSWVTWRSYGDYCGWAPLPPAAHYRPGIGFTYFGRGVDVSFGFGLGYDAFCFTPVSRFHDRHVYRHALPRHDVYRVFEHSRVANNWEFRNNGREFVNRSESRVERGVRPAVVRDMSQNDRSRWGNRERVERNGRDTVIYRPNPPAPTTTAGAGGIRPGRGDFNGRPSRAEVLTGAAAASGVTTPVGTPQPATRRERGGLTPATGTVTSRPIPTPTTETGTRSPERTRPQFPTRSSTVAGTPTPAGEPQVVNSSRRSSAIGSRVAEPTTPAPVVSTPAPAQPTSNPQVITRSSVSPGTPPPSRIGEPTVVNPSLRTRLADNTPAVTPIPGTEASSPRRRQVSELSRRIESPTPAPAPVPATAVQTPNPVSRREFSRPVTPLSPAPQVNTPSRVESAPPPIQRSAPAPSYSAPPVSRGPVVSTPAPISRAPAVNTPSAPPARAPQVQQAPVSRGPSREAGAPSPASRDGRRGRD